MKYPALIISLFFAAAAAAQTFEIKELYASSDSLDTEKLFTLPGLGLFEIAGNTLIPLDGDKSVAFDSIEIPDSLDIDNAVAADGRIIFQSGNTLYSYSLSDMEFMQECVLDTYFFRIHPGYGEKIIITCSSEDKESHRIMEYDTVNGSVIPVISMAEETVGIAGTSGWYIIATDRHIYELEENKATLLLESPEPINAMQITPYGIFYCTDTKLCIARGNNEYTQCTDVGFADILADGNTLYLITEDNAIYSLNPAITP